MGGGGDEGELGGKLEGLGGQIPAQAWRALLASGAPRRADLTDAQWAVLEPLLPRGRKPGRPPAWTTRQLIDGIRWRVRAGAPWRDVPGAYGPWQMVYGLFRCWQRDGTWRKILTALQARGDAAGLITWDVSVDSTIARAHQHAAGARKRGPADRPARRRAG